MTYQILNSYALTVHRFNVYPLALAAGHDRACSRMTEEAKRHPDLHSLCTLGSYPEGGIMHTIHSTKF